MKKTKFISPGTNRGNRKLQALDPAYVRLDVHDSAAWMNYAIAYAKKLRFIPDLGIEGEWETILAEASQDWTGFLGDSKGQAITEFKRFLADPDNYEANSTDALATPHIALFVAFLRILEHASSELNGFTKRHLAHYYKEILKQSLLEAKPATTYVELKLQGDTENILIPEGQALKGLIKEKGQAFRAKTKTDIELHQAEIGEVRTLFCNFEKAGLRAMIDPSFAECGMKAIRDKVWPLVHQIALKGEGANSFDEIFANVSNRENQREFPMVDFQLTVEEFLQMMALKPTSAVLSEAEEIIFRKWEFLHAYMSIRAYTPEAVPPSIISEKSLERKLEAALFLGDPLPQYQGKPANLKLVFEHAFTDAAHSDRDLAIDYIRNVLFMDPNSFRVLYDLSENRNSLPIRPDSIQEAVIRKAATTNIESLRQIVAEIKPGNDVLKSAAEESAWHPFGYETDLKENSLRFDDFGLYIESSVFNMSEGNRSISLDIQFAEIDWDVLERFIDISSTLNDEWKIPFAFKLSSEKEWLNVNWRNKIPELDIESRSIKLTLELEPAQAAVTAPGEKFPEPDLYGREALLMIRLDPPTEVVGDDAFYVFKSLAHSLRISKIGIEVNVNDISEFLAENQDDNIDVTSPFEPFGRDPGPGAYLSIAHPEICLKPLDELRLEFNWLRLPSDLEERYNNYFAKMGKFDSLIHPNCKPEDFTATAKAVTGARTKVLAQNTKAILENEQTIDLSELPFLEAKFSKEEIEKWTNIKHWPRYFRLNYDANWYPEEEYDKASRRLSNAISQASLELSRASSAFAVAPEGTIDGNPGSKKNKDWYEEAADAMDALSLISLEAPYVPSASSVKIGYTARIEIALQEWSENETQLANLFHRLPFGIKDLPQGNGMPLQMFPVFTNEGSLMVGLNNMEAGKSVSLLMKVQEGSGDPDTVPPSIKWWYFAQSGWTQFPARLIIEDQTNGLVETGLLRLTMPDDAIPASIELPGNMFWLMATVEKGSKGFPKFSNIHLHVVEVKLDDDKGAIGQNNAWYLPSQSIVGFEGKVDGIENLSQPYASSNGIPPENDEDFAQRVSERLRHKGRALTSWDYEHLCLQKFHNIYAVKTIQSMPGFNRRPGRVDLIVVPDLRHREFADPYQPKFGFGELNAISDFANRLSSPFASVKAKNPSYRPVLVDAKINFKKGVSASMGKYLVHDRLKRFLAPWAFDTATPMAFGGRLYVSQIVEILQAEPYIDYIGKTRLFVTDDNGKYIEAESADSDGGAYIEADSDDVLTSAISHLINEVADEQEEGAVWEGISWRMINFDFEIAVDANSQVETFEEWMGISWMLVGEDFNLPFDQE